MTDTAAGGPLVFRDDLRGFCAAAFVAAGLPPDQAALVADCLVEADLRGVESHGASRMGIYLKRIARGSFNVGATVREERRGAVAVIDGDNGMGPVVGARAMRAACDLAADYGVGVATARNSNHYGIAAYYLTEPLARGCVALTCSNATPTVAPHGGADGILGTNPIAYGIPAGRHPAIIGDIATSSTAAGRIVLAKNRGQSLPPDLALDREGRPTTDPAAALAGALRTFGGHKGSALSLLVEGLAGALSGARILTEIPHFLNDLDAPSGYGQFFLALDIAHFMDPAAFAARVDGMIDILKASRPAEGHDGVRIPGERSHALRTQRLRDGIPVPPDVLAQLDALARELGAKPVRRAA